MDFKMYYQKERKSVCFKSEVKRIRFVFEYNNLKLLIIVGLKEIENEILRK